MVLSQEQKCDTIRDKPTYKPCYMIFLNNVFYQCSQDHYQMTHRCHLSKSLWTLRTMTGQNYHHIMSEYGKTDINRLVGKQLLRRLGNLISSSVYYRKWPSRRGSYLFSSLQRAACPSTLHLVERNTCGASQSWGWISASPLNGCDRRQMPSLPELVLLEQTVISLSPSVVVTRSKQDNSHKGPGSISSKLQVSR